MTLFLFAKGVFTVEEKIYTTKDISELLNVTQRTVWVWLKQGKLKAFPIGGHKAGYRITQAALDEFIQERTGKRIDD